MSCLVVDPVMISKHGDPLLADDAVRLMIDRLFPLATLVTPNLHEASALTGRSITSELDMMEAPTLMCSSATQHSHCFTHLNKMHMHLTALLSPFALGCSPHLWQLQLLSAWSQESFSRASASGQLMLGPVCISLASQMCQIFHMESV